MFEIAEKYSITLDAEISRMLAAGAIVACGVSGGKDSDALALNVNRFLDEIGHDPQNRVLIHSDLGSVEHADSLPQCQRLSEKTGIPLIVVKPNRPLIERFEKRWFDNAARYARLSTVKLVTPWSSQAMRFCTSEAKVAPICRELKKRFAGKQIINAVGIRAEESKKRAGKPISQPNKLITVKTKGTTGRDWNAIRDMKIETVWLAHRREGFRAHEGYEKNGNSRISCSCCTLATTDEIRASMRDERNHATYRRLVALEIVSTYSFSQNYWLGDVCPELLDAAALVALKRAKEKAIARRLIEKEIPSELLYVKQDFPRRQWTLEESALIADVRIRIGKTMALTVACTTAQEVYDRCAFLLQEKERKEAAKAKKKKRAAARAPYL
jgi:3'-phosphoadenosine 5'-phosphosulfate sulfotransferase (PAPS reductase)/FAD synthetase